MPKQRIVQVKATANRKAHTRRLPRRKRKTSELSSPTPKLSLREQLAQAERDALRWFNEANNLREELDTLRAHVKNLNDIVGVYKSHINCMTVGNERLADGLAHVTSHILKDGPRAINEVNKARRTTDGETGHHNF